MKETKKWAILFILIFILLLTIINIPFQKYQKYGYQYANNITKVNYLENHQIDPDGIVLGDSVGWAAINPTVFKKELGVKLYNACTPGQDFSDSYLMLETALRTQKFKFVILEANAYFNITNPLKFLTSKVFPAIHYHSFQKLKKTAKSVGNGKDGFNDSDVVVPYGGGQSYLDRQSRFVYVNLSTRYYLSKMIELCRQNDLPLVIVNTPNAASWTNQKHAILEAALTNENVYYLDLNQQVEQMQYDWLTDSRDGGDHCNHSGAKKVSSFLVKYLKEIQLIDWSSIS